MKRTLVNAAIAAAGLGVLFAVDGSYRAKVRAENEGALASAAEKAADALSVAMTVPVTATEDLQAFMLAPERLPDDAAFDRFAGRLMEHHPIIRAVQYVSPDRIIRHIYPLAGNEEALNLDLTTRPARPFVEKAIRERRLTVNPPTVTVQGKLSIVPRAPLYRGDELLGLVQTLIEIDHVLDITRRNLDDAFEAELRDANGNRFWGPGVLGSPIASDTVPVGDGSWTLSVGWRGSPPDSAAFPLALLWGGGGLFLASLLFFVNRAWLQRDWLEREVEKKTRSLRTEAAERERAEAQIRLQANMLDAVGSAVIATELDGRVIYWNRAAEALYGWSPSEALGRNIEDLILAAQAREEALAIMERLRAGDVWSGEFLVQRKDGTTFPALVVDSPVSSATGELVAIIGVSNDLTERKRMEEALRDTESLLRTVLSNAPITVFATDREGIFTLSMGKGLQGVGLEAGEHIGDSAIELYGGLPFTDESGEEISGEDVLRRALSGETVTAGNELRGTCFINRVGPMRDAEGRIVGAVGVATDITELKRAEEALRHQKELLQTIVDNIPVMIAFIDPEGQTLWVNRHWQRVLGWSLEEATSRDILPEMFPDPERRQEVLEFALTARGNWRDFPSRTKSGRMVDTSWANVLLSDGTSIGIGQDITERKRSEEALRQRQRELETLLDISRRLSAELNVEELLQSIVGSVVDTLPAAEAASLWLYDEARQRLLPHAWAGHPNSDFEGLSHAPADTLVGRVFSAGEAMLFADAASEAEFIPLGRPGLDRLKSLIGAPLRIRGRVVGALFGDNFSKRQAFGETDLLLLEGLAAQAGIALGNAWFFEETKRGRARVRALSTRLAVSEEEERRALSKKLHDQVSQSLTALGINLELLRSRLQTDPPATSEARLTVAQETVAEITERIRDVMTELHPSVLEDYGLLAALRWHAERLGLGTGLEVEVAGEPVEPPLPLASAMSLFRIAQEALVNVAKHADVERARILVEAEPALVRLTVADEGVGFDPEALAPEIGVHWGLPTMRERAEALGGRLRVVSGPGRGTRVVVEVPR